jgi:acetoin utilization protein AcuB
MKHTKVEQYMTRGAHTIGREQTLATAHRMMREHGFRHLPVLDGGKLVGIVSQRDLHLIETLADVNPDEVRVEEAMTTEVFTVRPDAPLAEVARTMADQKLGSAVVMVGEKVVGIFTAVDAHRALADLLTK